MASTSRLPESVLIKKIPKFRKNHFVKKHDKHGCGQRTSLIVRRYTKDRTESSYYYWRGIVMCTVCGREYELDLSKRRYEGYYRIGDVIKPLNIFQRHSTFTFNLIFFSVLSVFVFGLSAFLNNQQAKFDKKVAAADLAYIYKDGEKAKCHVYASNDNSGTRTWVDCGVEKKTAPGVYVAKFASPTNGGVQVSEEIRALDMQPVQP